MGTITHLRAVLRKQCPISTWLPSQTLILRIGLISSSRNANLAPFNTCCQTERISTNQIRLVQMNFSDRPEVEVVANARRRSIPSLRWWIGGLLFASTVINYVDRQTLSLLA